MPEPGAVLILRGNGNQLHQDQPPSLLTAYNWSNKSSVLPAPRRLSMKANEGATAYNSSIHVERHQDRHDTLHRQFRLVLTECGIVCSFF